MRIIFLVGKKWTERDSYRFGVDKLREQGIGAEVWDDKSNLPQRLGRLGHGDFVLTDFRQHGNYDIDPMEMAEIMSALESTPMPFGVLIGNKLPEISRLELVLYYLRSYIEKAWRFLRFKSTLSRRLR